jgi:hypothetical protein
MLKISYETVNETENLDDVAIYNIKETDKYETLEPFMFSTIGWLKNDDKRTFKDLELTLRINNLKTYIVAVETTIPDNYNICMPNKNNNEMKYVAKLTNDKYENVLEDILKYHASYEDNLKALEKAGNLMPIEENKENKNELNELLINNKIKLLFKMVEGKEFIDYIIEDATIKFGKKPEKKIVGKLGAKTVYGFVIDNKIINKHGWIEETENDEIKYTIIDLLKKS